MNKPIIISSIYAEDLRKGVYKSQLPEYYSLKSIVENNPWHLGQNVFDHATAVFAGLESVLSLDFLQKSAKTRTTEYLSEKVEKSTKRELLIVATVLHDIAKVETLIKDPSGSTRCPGHEIIGSTMVTNFSARFGLDRESKRRVQKIVLYHGFVHDILGLAINKGKDLEYFNLLVKAVPDAYIELLLLAYADMLGSDLQRVDPTEFDRRVNLIVKFLEKNLFSIDKQVNP